MVNELLISFSDFKQYKHLSENVNKEADIMPYILEAQRLDIRPFLGDALYYDIVKTYPYPDVTVNDPLVTNYTPLIEGEEYTNCNNELVMFYGLKPSIVYFAYARLLSYLGKKATRTGYNRKTNDFSEPVSGREREDDINNARSNAIYYQNDTIDYLQENKDVYTLWNRGKSVLVKSSIKIYSSSGLTKTVDQGESIRYNSDRND